MGRKKQRSAPAGGYAFDAKALWRRFVWQCIRSRSPWAEPKQPVLLMPSLEGIEIEQAKSVGFRESSLHVVDKNPAIVATLKRKYPDVNTYGVSVMRAHQRLAKNNVRLYGASIDLCSNAVWRTAQQLSVCSQYDVWQSDARIVVNFLRGREEAGTRASMVVDRGALKAAWLGEALSKWQTPEVKPTVRDAWRIWLLAFGLPNHFARVSRAYAYVSSNGQSFLTVSYVVTRVADAVFKNHGVSKRVAELYAREMALRNTFSVIEALGIGDEATTYPAWAVRNAIARTHALDTAVGTQERGLDASAVHRTFATLEKFGHAFAESVA